MSDESWGQLVSLTDIESDPIPLKADKFIIGRAAGRENMTSIVFCEKLTPFSQMVTGHFGP